jgi:hypothetical protein
MPSINKLSEHFYHKTKMSARSNFTHLDAVKGRRHDARRPDVGLGGSV